MQFVEGYELLANILTDAFEQSATGKGRERHGLGDPWDKQPIITLGREFGIGGTNFQSAKKMREAQKMAERGEYGAAERELLGAIVYAAASVALVREAAEKKSCYENTTGHPLQVVDSEGVPVQTVAVGQTFLPPIPWGMFYDPEAMTFRDEDGVTSNTEFYMKWAARREEFPVWFKNPIPMGVFWDSANDVFRNGDGTILMNYGCWLNRKDEFPTWVSRPL